jgi:carboxypeptidase C (cathepsin A)
MFQEDFNCPEGIHSVKTLPYFNQDSNKMPCMSAGTLPSNNSGTHNLFYWLYRNASGSDAPLTIWMNGGPGSTSSYGNFLFNGPLRFNHNEQDEFTVDLAEEGSWVEYSNMVYLD